MLIVLDKEGRELLRRDHDVLASSNACRLAREREETVYVGVGGNVRSIADVRPTDTVGGILGRLKLATTLDGWKPIGGKYWRTR